MFWSNRTRTETTSSSLSSRCLAPESRQPRAVDAAVQAFDARTQSLRARQQVGGLLRMARRPGLSSLLLWLGLLVLLSGVTVLQQRSQALAQITPAPTPGPTLVGEPPPHAWDVSPRTVRLPFLPAKQAKLDSSLLGFQHALPAGLLPEEINRNAAAQGLRAEAGRVQVQIVVEPGAGDKVTALLTRWGGQVTGQGHGGSLLQAWAPPGVLPLLQLQPEVHYLRAPPRLEPLSQARGPASADVDQTFTQALDDSNAAAWIASGWTGAGTRVGIIDAGFQGYTQLLGTELPAHVRTANFVDGEPPADVDSATRHGAAIAEIVHDMAPGAALFLAKIETDVDMEEAARWLLDQDVDVIVTAIGWYNLSPGDGSGPLAELVAQAEQAGALWVTAAGNDRERHWGGLFFDPDLDGYHNFALTQEVNFFGPEGGGVYLIPPGYALTIHVRWNDWAQVDQDYDLFLVRWDGSTWETIAGSRNPQNGEPGQTPTESISAVTRGEPTAYGFLIRRYRATGAPVNFEVFTPRFFRPSQITPERSLPNLADAPAALTVAALEAQAPYSVQSYSSQGPTNGPGGSPTGGLPKPDMAAYTNISTASYGGSLFTGASAAAPHAAGAAALLAQAYRDALPGELRAMLTQRAVGLPQGKSIRTGAGRLHLGPAPANLTRSSFTLAWGDLALTNVLTYELHLVNSGGVTATVNLNIPLPPGLTVREPPTISSGERPLTTAHGLTWTGPVPPGGAVTLRYRGEIQESADSLRLLTVANLRDDEGRRYFLSAALNPWQLFLPFTSAASARTAPKPPSAPG